MQDLASRMTQEDEYCGTKCQLRKNVLAARNAAETAPTNLARARKKYIEFAKGAEYYDTVRERELARRAQTQADATAAAFDEQARYVIAIGQAYDTQRSSADFVTELDWNLRREEGELQINARDTQDDIVTSDRKSWYRLENIETMQWRYAILRFAYLTFTCCMMALYAFRQKQGGTSIPKIALHVAGIGMLFLWLLPFWSFPIMHALWSWVRRVCSMLRSWSPFKSDLLL